MRQFAMAAMAGDQDEQQRMRAEIAGSNREESTAPILPAHLRQSIRNRRKRIEESASGVYLPKSRRDAMEAGRFGAE